MKVLGLLSSGFLLFTVLILVGCGKKSDAVAELEKAVKTAEQSAQGQPAPVAANVNTPLNQPVAQQMSQALISLKAGNYSDAVTLMQAARVNPNRTADQAMAAQDALAALMNDLAIRAANGDALAKQAINKERENRNKR